MIKWIIAQRFNGRKTMQFSLVVLALSLLLPMMPEVAAAQAGNQLKTLAIGYLELASDPRYDETHMKAMYPAQPWGRPYPGAVVAVNESRFQAMAAGLQFNLRREIAAKPAQLQPMLKQMIAGGVHFVLLDLPGNEIARLAKSVQGKDVMLFNVSALSDSLRQRQCQANLWNLAPSRAMLTDALAQYLVFKKWRNVLVLRGPRPADENYFRAFQRSAKRFGLEFENVKDFVLGTNPRERSQNNVALLTAGSNADVVMVVDSDGEFARAVPYQTQRPQSVVGSAGLVPDWWHWSWSRSGGLQLTDRFMDETGRLMTGYDWSAWVGVKVIAEAVLRTRSGNFKKLQDYIRGDQLVIDGFKDYPLSFRPWNHQLRQPIFLTTGDWVVAVAPLPGFLEQANNLDTLGFDETENQCEF
ncbi:MAG: amino acid ABC transporter substrate-binding protein [Pseudomonadota bacterium]|nr:amino acid ABC transporter substrate-binding protein [Pseudomonadota bacterium]